MVILFILSIMGITLLVNQIRHVGPSESPVLACCAIIAYMYLFALLGLLNAGVYSLLVFGVLAIPFVLYLNRKSLADYMKSLTEPGFVVFVILLIALYPICRPIVTGAWDEYSHWALIVRNMMLTGSLPKAGGAIRFITYPPATSLLQYFFMKTTNGSEGMMYYGQAVFMASCICAMLKGQKLQKPFHLLLALLLPLVVVIKFSLHNVFNIFTDSIMAILAAASFAIYYASERKGRDILKLAPVFFTISLIRTNAVLYAVFAILLILTDQIRRGKDRDQGLIKSLLTMLLPIVLGLGSWYIHLQALGVAGGNSVIFPIDWALFGRVAHNFAVALMFKSAGNANPLLTKFTTSFAMCVMGGVLLAVMQFALRRDKGLRREFNAFGILFIAYFILYCAGMLLAYQFAFTAYEAEQVAGFGRYIGSFFTFAVAGIGYMMVFMLSRKNLEKDARSMISVLSVLVILAMAGLSYPSMLNAVGGRRLENVYEQESKDCAADIQDAVGTEAKVYMIFQKSRGYTFMGTRYQLGTNPTNLGSWSFGPAYSEADTWTVDWPPQTLAKVLVEQGYEYVYIGHGDEQLWNGYGELFDKPDQGYIIYRVNPDNKPLLTAVILPRTICKLN